MNVIPAIDLMDGKVVQLVGGKPETKKIYGEPVETALEWKKQGASILHVVDLDAALDRESNLDCVIEIKKQSGLQVHFGGGIRSLEKARQVLDEDIDRIVLGTVLVKDRRDSYRLLNELCSSYGGDRLIAAVDSLDGRVVVEGWTEETGLETTELIKELEDRVWGFLYTDVGVEGKMRGVNLDGIKRVVDSTRNPFIVSGGVTTVDDVKNIESTGAWGIVLGKALYEGKLSLKDVL